jgi:protocatechuate 3,4-dioxygenase beta subunit
MSLLIVLGLAGALMQAPAASSAGTVSGRVVEDGSGAPVANAQVVLIPIRQGPPVAMPFHDRPRTATSDADGRYLFEEVEPGKYRISVQKAGYALEMFNPRLPDIEVKPGARRDGADVTLKRGGVIVGRVLDESGEPVVNARVTAMHKLPNAGEMAHARANILVPAGPGGETNDLGEFRLFSLAPGDYYVHAAPRPHLDGMPARRGTTMLQTYFPNAPDSQAAHPVTVAAGQTSGDIVVRMISAPAFEVSGVVIDDAGRPVENAVVRLDVGDPAAWGPLMMARWNQGRTDASGRFTISDMTNGSYTLLAIAPVAISGAQKRWSAGGGAGSGGMTVSSGVGGSMGGGVLTESNGGTTVEYRDDRATRVPVTIQDANVGGLEVVVRRPGR